MREELLTYIDIYVLGTNSIATSAMMKAHANKGATGENVIITSVNKVNNEVEKINTQQVEDNICKDKFKLVKVDTNRVETSSSCLCFKFSNFNNQMLKSQIVMMYRQRYIGNSYNLRWLKDNYKIKMQIRYIEGNSSNLYLKIEDNNQIVYIRKCIILNE